MRDDPSTPPLRPSAPRRFSLRPAAPATPRLDPQALHDPDDPFGPIGPPSAKRSRAQTLRSILGRMRRIVGRRHRAADDPVCRGAAETLYLELKRLSDAQGGDEAFASRLAAWAAALHTASVAGTDAPPLRARRAAEYRRWAEGVTRLAGGERPA